MAEVKVIRTDCQAQCRNRRNDCAGYCSFFASLYGLFLRWNQASQHCSITTTTHTPFKFSQDDWLHIHRGLKMTIEMVDKEGMSSNVVFDIHADKWVEIYSTNTPMFELTGCFKFDFVDTPLDMKTMTFDVVANTAKQLNSKGKWCQPEIHNGNEQECACRSTATGACRPRTPAAIVQ